MPGFVGERVLETDEAVLRGARVEDALQRDDAALAAHRLEHRLGDLADRQSLPSKVMCEIQVS